MYTSSISWPNMFNVAQNKVNVLEDSVSVINRTKLLILTEPTELYNEPNQGVGLKRYLWQYNNKNLIALISDRINDQLRLHEPCVTASNTQFTDSLLFTGNTDPNSLIQDFNRLKMTVAVETNFGDKVDIQLNGGDQT